MVKEEERERRMDYVPEESAVNTDIIEARLSCPLCSALLRLCASAQNDSTSLSHGR